MKSPDVKPIDGSLTRERIFLRDDLGEIGMNLVMTCIAAFSLNNLLSSLFGLELILLDLSAEETKPRLELTGSFGCCFPLPPGVKMILKANLRNSRFVIEYAIGLKAELSMPRNNSTVLSVAYCVSGHKLN